MNGDEGRWTGFAAAASIAVCVAALGAAPARAGERAGVVTFDIQVTAPRDARQVKLWFPYPISDAAQTIEGLRFEGDYATFTLAREPLSGALYLFTQWTEPAPERHLVVTFHARAKERGVAKLVDAGEPIPAEVRGYLDASAWVPSDHPKVKARAEEIVSGRKGILERARAVYDWVIDNTRRDPGAPGCGFGDVEATLSSRAGKCADIGSLFVALARAGGVPAREVFGLRLGRPGQVDISEGHHCWAEFYLPGTGWVPVDPAEVQRELLLARLEPATARARRERSFGRVDEHRIVLHRGGRGVSFAEGNVAKVNYFMYPYAEVDGRPLDFCRPKSFAYTIRFEEG